MAQLREVTILSPEDCMKILQRWQRDGLTEEEKNEFKVAILAQLNDTAQIEMFEEDIGKLTDLILDTNKTFGDVYYYLVATKGGFESPIVKRWKNDIMQKGWLKCLRDSYYVARTNFDLLKELNNHLTKVLNIKTDDDRKAVITLLEGLNADLKENDKSSEMSDEFKQLMRNVADFTRDINLKVSEVAKEIEILDEQINSAQEALGIVGGSFSDILGLAGRASSVVASLKAQRDKKAERLRHTQLTLVALNKLQVSQPDWPNLEELAQKLGMFTKTWLSCRDEVVQIQTHLNDGLEASTDPLFQHEVNATIKISAPLQEGLKNYANYLADWDWIF